MNYENAIKLVDRILKIIKITVFSLAGVIFVSMYFFRNTTNENITQSFIVATWILLFLAFVSIAVTIVKIILIRKQKNNQEK